jgi:NAD(P)H-flavin reductase
VTQPADGWQGGSGRVQGRLEAAVKGRESTVDIYFCGRPEMIAECCELLQSRGIGSDALLFERHS